MIATFIFVILYLIVMFGFIYFARIAEVVMAILMGDKDTISRMGNLCQPPPPEEEPVPDLPWRSSWRDPWHDPNRRRR